MYRSGERVMWFPLPKWLLVQKYLLWAVGVSACIVVSIV